MPAIKTYLRNSLIILILFSLNCTLSATNTGLKMKLAIINLDIDTFDLSQWHIDLTTGAIVKNGKSYFVNLQNPSMSYLDKHTKPSNTFGGYLVAGTSLTYNWDHNENITGIEYHWSEYTWHLNLAYAISKKWRIGVNSMAIFTTTTRKTGLLNFLILGANTQYNIVIDENKNRIYADVGIYSGNYCTCGEGEPYKREGLKYIGFGLGGDVKISKHFHLDVAFYDYEILNKIKDKSNHTQYIIGLDYHF